MNNIYTDGRYLESNQSWHVEDSRWKAEQIRIIIQKNQLRPKIIAEVGCGAGAILEELSKLSQLKDACFEGYDISPQAIERAKRVENESIVFFQEDLLNDTNKKFFDILLVIDVLEHIPDYMGFAEKCKDKAEYKIYHIPLSIHVSALLRNTAIKSRYTIGHIQQFTADSAIATLEDTGHLIIDYHYTNPALGLFREHPSLKKAIANIPRWCFSKVNLPFTARVFGGYSLLVLAK